MNPLTEASSGGIDIVSSLTPILNSALSQIVSMITALVPFMVTVALFGAGIYLVKRFINQGTKSIG